jgi:malonyl-CoA O-methyltransferase
MHAIRIRVAIRSVSPHRYNCTVNQPNPPAGPTLAGAPAAAADEPHEPAGKPHEPAGEPHEPAGEPFYTDRAALKRNFSRAAATFAQGDALHREIASRMLERLGYIKIDPARVLDLGSATGSALPGLQARYPKAQLTALDIARPMLAAAAGALAGAKPASTPWHARLAAALGKKAALPAVQADMAQLPFKSNALDLVWSNLALHWLDDPAPAIREAQRTLAVDGLFMFSTLGPDTLMELREAFAAAGLTPAQKGAWHVKRFIDLHDIGDVLVGAGFTTPVMDMEKITLTYETLDGLFADLRASGSVNAMAGRGRGLLGRETLARVRDAYESWRGKRGDARLPATFEVIYGHAWKGQPRRTAGGDAVINFVPSGQFRARR